MEEHDDEPTAVDAPADDGETPTLKLGGCAETGIPPAHDPQLPNVGQIFASKYKIVEVLGQGAFARVYRAIQLGLDRTVAIKVLLPRSTSHEAVAARFWREAKVLGRLKNKHTVALYDFGEMSDGSLFMVFEFVPGTTLEALLRQGALPGAQVEAVLEQLLGSLAEAHGAGVLHRDIKPANIMVQTTSDGLEATLIDFGIAKSFVGEGDLNATAEGSVIGTPRYMSPEQLCGESLQPSSDLFSLALVGYEMLTGSPARTSRREVLRASGGDASNTIPPGVDVTPQLRMLIESCLEPHPARRPQTADEARTFLYSDTAIFPPSTRRSRLRVLLVIGGSLLAVGALLWTADKPEVETISSVALGAVAADAGVTDAAVTQSETRADITLLVGEVRSFGAYEPDRLTIENTNVAKWSKVGRRAVLSGSQVGRTTMTLEEGNEVSSFSVEVVDFKDLGANADTPPRLTLWETTSLEFPTGEVRQITVGATKHIGVKHDEERGVFVVTGKSQGTSTLSLLTDETEDVFLVSVVATPSTLFAPAAPADDRDRREVDVSGQEHHSAP